MDRADELRRAFDEDQRLFLTPGVITERDRIGAGVEQLVVDRLRDADPAGRVLAVDENHIERPVAPERRQALVHCNAPAAANDVAVEKDAHTAQFLRISISFLTIMP